MHFSIFQQKIMVYILSVFTEMVYRRLGYKTFGQTTFDDNTTKTFGLVMFKL